MNALLDFLQAASNAAASNVSGPVDLIGMALRKAGVPVPTNSLLSSEWMAEKGLTKQPQNRLAALAGETAGLLAPIGAAAKAPQIAKGLLQMEANAAAPSTLNPQLGAIVYHGSPHKFDKFDSSKIGTGEGAQAYGHGLYFAETPEVADAYKRSNMFGVQNAFKNTGGELPQIDEVTFLGRRIGGFAGDGAALRPGGAADPGMSAGLRGFPAGGTADSVANLGYGATPAKLRALAPDLSDSERLALQAIINANGRPDTAAAVLRAKGKTEAAKIAEDAAQGFAVTRMSSGTGSLYTVDLPDTAIARMLDWDKPLSQQAPEVQKALEGFAKPAMRGSEIYESWAAESLAKQGAGANHNAYAANLAKQFGLPGIKYLDGGSRGAGAGTSNFVVFPGEENILKILARNGQPLP